MDFQIPFNNLLAKIIAKANNKAKNKWNKTDEFPAKIKRRITGDRVKAIRHRITTMIRGVNTACKRDNKPEKASKVSIPPPIISEL